MLLGLRSEPFHIRYFKLVAERHVKMELIEHVGITPVEQQAALAQIKARAMTARDLVLLQRPAEAVEIHDAAGAQLIELLALIVGNEGEEAIKGSEAELGQYHRRLTAGE